MVLSCYVNTNLIFDLPQVFVQIFIHVLLIVVIELLSNPTWSNHDQNNVMRFEINYCTTNIHNFVNEYCYYSSPVAEVILVRACHVHLQRAELIRVVLSTSGIDPVEGAETVAIKPSPLSWVVDVNMDLFPLKSWPKSKL